MVIKPFIILKKLRSAWAFFLFVFSSPNYNRRTSALLLVTFVFTNKHKSIVNRISVSYTYKYCLSFAENYKFTTCGLCINSKTNRIVKKVYNSRSIGFNIKSKFYSLKKLRQYLVKHKTIKIPF